MESLFGAIARNHEVDIALVRAHTTVRNGRFDLVVLISFGLIYTIAAICWQGSSLGALEPTIGGLARSLSLGSPSARQSPE